MKPPFLSALKSALSEGVLLTGAEECIPYATDWTKTPGQADAVAVPRSVAEVSKVLALCHQHAVGVVPSGGRTGLAAGAVPAAGQLVLSLEKLNRLGTVSQLSRTLRVGAGVITESVHQHCEAANLTWPIDLASKGSCQIGGNLSTNAGGLRVIRHGMARKWVTGLQVVTMSGSILELNSDLEKNNTGYDLLQLMVGSEGTLGVITEATLKLAPISRDVNKAVFFFALKSIEGLPYVFEKARQGPFDILAFEFFSHRCLRAVEEKLKRKSRLAQSGVFYVVMEVAGPESRDAWLEALLAGGMVVDALQAESSEDRKAVWGLREGITESIALTGRARKHDLSVPIASVAPFLTELEAALQKDKYALELFLFGHFGDGSPHVNLVNPSGTSFDAFNRDCDRFEDVLFPLLQKYRGSISSEHGIGLLKKKWLGFSRTAEEIRIFRGIKAALDPKALLNPGKILDF